MLSARGAINSGGDHRRAARIILSLPPSLGGIYNARGRKSKRRNHLVLPALLPKIYSPRATDDPRTYTISPGWRFLRARAI